MNALWERIVRFNDEFFPGWKNSKLVYLSNALAGEAGEALEDALGILVATSGLAAKIGKLADLAKHMIGGGTHRKNPTVEDFLEELADVQIYVVIAAETAGCDQANFDAIVAGKLDKVRARMTAPNDVYKDFQR